MKTSLFPKKSLGQNFLIDPNIQDKIVQSCQFKKTDQVIEIGPGLGAITEQVASRVQKVAAVEKDRRLAQYLKENLIAKNIRIINEDFLKYSLAGLKGTYRVVGNLPYNIATPIIEKLIQYRRKISTAHIMVQKEYGQRILAQPNSKEYGSLSCYVQYYCDVKKLLLIKNTAFKPRPKVQSVFLKLKFLSQPRYSVDDEKVFFSTIRNAFNYRRKTLLNALSQNKDKSPLESLLRKLHIPPNTRAENVNLHDYARLANELIKLK